MNKSNFVVAILFVLFQVLFESAFGKETDKSDVLSRMLSSSNQARLKLPKLPKLPPLPQLPQLPQLPFDIDQQDLNKIIQNDCETNCYSGTLTNVPGKHLLSGELQVPY